MSDETRPGGLAPAGSPAPHQEAERLGNYRLLQKLGEGGMGEVYRAEQERPVHRIVALKLIKWGMDTKRVIARFESERQALALMEHPSIARVFDAGATAEGRPYFVMEYVDGVPIDAYCDGAAASTEDRLELFLSVCDGVEHAHQKGIIHRDLKPSNLLVHADGAHAIPKIIDFGIAKAVSTRTGEQTLLTELGQLVGTPEYMSPEQLDEAGGDIDTRADIYSLGVLLYRLLTGAVPFDLAPGRFDEFRRLVREHEPVRPSARVADGTPAGRARARRLGGDLDWITLKALEKDRARRYGSVSELALDVRRHLDDQPVLAGPPSHTYRAAKFIRRHRTGVIAAALVAVALVTGAAAAMVGLVRALHAEGEARRAEAKAEYEAVVASNIASFLESLLQQSDPDQARGHSVTVREVLDQGAREIRNSMSSKPLLRARLMDTIGRVYTNLGHYDDAQPLLDDALAIREQMLDDGDPELVGSLRSLQKLADAKGDLARARQLSERALAIMEATHEADDPELASDLHNLANTLARMGDQRGARPLYQRALALRMAALGPDHPDLASTLQGLASVLRDLGDNRAARPLYEHALAVLEQANGPDHPSLAPVLDNLAHLFQEMHDPAAAEPLFARALRIAETTYEGDHLDVAVALFSLGNLLAENGRPAAARPYLDRALAIRERVLGREHSLVGKTAWVVAGVHRDLGDRGGADALYRKALAIKRLHAIGTESQLAYDEACYEAFAGHRAAALRHLRHAILLGWTDGDWLERDRDLRSLHGDPEFERLVAGLKARGPA